MKRLMVILVACVLLIATVGYGGDMDRTETNNSFAGIPIDKDIELMKEKKIELIKQWTKEGLICEVFGHRWGEPHYEFATVRGDETKANKDSLCMFVRIVRPHGTYRKCKVCGKEQFLTESHWDDFEEAK